MFLVSRGLEYRHLARYVACSTHPRCRCVRLKYAKHDAERLAQGDHPMCTFFDGDRRCGCSSTMEHYDGPPGTLTAPIHSWTNGDSSVFRVRGRNYTQDRLKVVPGEPLGIFLHELWQNWSVFCCCCDAMVHLACELHCQYMTIYVS